MKTLLAICFSAISVSSGADKFVGPYEGCLPASVVAGRIGYLALTGDKILNLDTLTLQTRTKIPLDEFQSSTLKLQVYIFPDSTYKKAVLSDSVKVSGFEFIIIPEKGEFRAWKVSADTVPAECVAHLAPGTKIIIQGIRANFGSWRKNLAPIVINLMEPKQPDASGRKLD